MDRALRAEWVAPLLAAALFGCPSDDPTCAPKVVVTDFECQTAQDCIDEGFSNLSCVNARCVRACERDQDCVIDRDEIDSTCVGVGDPQPETPICESQLCRTGCPSTPCGPGETCADGRCAYDYEGFELAQGETFVDLQSIGFRAPEADPANPVNNVNPLTKIAQRGPSGCTVGDERCAGEPADGDRFVWLRYSPASAKGQADTAFTCRACACCLDCLANPPDTGQNVTLATCPGQPNRLWSLPQLLTCPATPPECSAVCTSCESCPMAAAGTVGARLAPCEEAAASRGCTTCQDCDSSVAACRSSTCSAVCANPNSAACGDCVTSMCLSAEVCVDCVACDESARCLLNGTSSAECADYRQRCDRLAADGCFPTPSNYERAQLFDTEQALTSRAIDLSAAAGNVVLQFDYVGFNVGRMFTVVEQGKDPSEWQMAAQEVIVQFCGGGCADDSSWIDGTSADGSRAIFPPVSRRDNGLTLGSQSEVDWRAGRFFVPVPDAVKTATFRYRFLPRLSDGASVGIDEIYVRPRP